MSLQFGLKSGRLARHGQGETHAIVSLIDDHDVIERILRRLGLVACLP